MTTDLRSALAERLAATEVPEGDVERARATGRVIRRRRRTALGAAAVVVVAALGSVAFSLSAFLATDPPAGRDDFASLGALDFSDGARAYADPGRTLHLGGRSFPAEQLDYLDTDAVATSHGIVFYDAGRPMLLGEDGDVVELEPDAETARGFHPTAKVDASGSVVAYGVRREGRTEVVVRDLSDGTEVVRREVPDETVVDAIDRRVVFLRTDDGTLAWDTGSDTTEKLAGTDTSIADVRGGVVLYDGEAPDGPVAGDYHKVKGAIDSLLSFDGRYVLGWSSKLEPTKDGDRPVVLEVQGAFFTFDTDGSVLVIEAPRNPYPEMSRKWIEFEEKGAGYSVHDCVLPSGACTDLGPLTAKHGDPMFIGNDM